MLDMRVFNFLTLGLIASKHFLVLQTLMIHFLRTSQSIGKRMKQKLLRQVIYIYIYQL